MNRECYVMIMQSEIQRRKNRWADFYIPDGNRQKFMIRIMCSQPTPPPYAPMGPQFYNERTEWAWNYYQYELEKHALYRDDTIPHCRLVEGTEFWAEAFGCKVYRAEDQMPMAIPYIHTAQEAAKLKTPRIEDSPSILSVFRRADEMRKRGGKEATLGLPDMQTPMDIVAQIWDKTDLFVAMIEEPEAVLELADKVKQLLFAFCDEFAARYGNGVIAHYPDYYMPQGFTFSADEVGNVSAEMFEQFFLNEIIELSDRYGGIGIHCCANSEHQWENFAKIPNLRLINLHQPKDVIRRAYEFFSRKTAQWNRHFVNALPNEVCNYEPEWFPAGTRVVIADFVDTVDEAKRLSDLYFERYGENDR